MFIRNSILVLMLHLISISQNAFAEPGHWLMGGSIGGADRSGNVAVVLRYVGPDGIFSKIPETNVIVDYSDSGFLTELFAGYEAHCESWILGAELSVDWEPFAKDHFFAFSDNLVQSGGNGLGWNGNVRFERDWVLGFSFRMGYELESLLYFFPPIFIPYIRLGFETSQDYLQTFYNGDLPVYPLASSGSHRQWTYRFLSGVGIEFPIKNSAFSVRFEFDYHSSGQTVEALCYINDNVAIKPLFATSTDPLVKSGKISFVWNFLS